MPNPSFPATEEWFCDDPEWVGNSAYRMGVCKSAAASGFSPEERERQFLAGEFGPDVAVNTGAAAGPTPNELSTAGWVVGGLGVGTLAAAFFGRSMLLGAGAGGLVGYGMAQLINSGTFREKKKAPKLTVREAAANATSQPAPVREARLNR